MPQIYTSATPAAHHAVVARNRAQSPESLTEIQRRRHEAFTREAVPMKAASSSREAVTAVAYTREVLLDREASTLTRRQVVALMEENQELREALRQMQEDLIPQAFVPPEWHLSGRERDLLLALRGGSPNVVHRERLLTALYGVLEQDMPDQKILDVFVCKLRRKLTVAESGVTIETVWGRGWRIDPENLARLNAHIEKASEPTWTPDTPLLIAAE